MLQDSSTICWEKAGKELCEIAQTNDFRKYFIIKIIDIEWELLLLSKLNKNLILKRG